MTAAQQGFPERGHDHAACLLQILSNAEAVCQQHKVRLTPQRRQVLEIVAGSHSPLGAYDILEQMDSSGRRSAPITVYRALDFLIEQGLVHRLTSLNAFTACVHSDSEHIAQFLICRACRTVAELKSSRVAQTIQQDAEHAGFAVDQQAVELTGICRDCGV